ncbi:MAG: hypothetical protein ACLPY5_15590 [Candidatus Bathyarchaeia archaeon]
MSTPTEIHDSLEIFKRDHPDPAKVGFIMMKFKDTKAHKEILYAIKSALTTRQLTGVRADDKEYHENLYENILTYAYGCGFGVAVFDRIEDGRP